MSASASAAPGESAPARKRRRILEAAERLFARHGFAKTVVSEIAAEAGVSKGLVYVHFPSKEALLAEVWMGQVARWRRTTGRAVAEAPTAPEKLARLLRTSIAYVEEHPLLRSHLAQDPAVYLGPTAEGAEFVAAYLEAVTGLLELGVRSGELRADLDVARTAELVWHLHFCLVRELFVTPLRGARRDGLDLVEAAVRLLASGVSPAPAH